MSSGDDNAVLDAGAASRSLASNPIFSRNLSKSSKMSEMKRLEGRLRVLEEESEVLRGVFLESLEGRAQLMGEICEKFENIQHYYFMLREQEREETCTNFEVQIVSPLKDRRAGLLQVLRHEPNPSLVRRDLKAKALV